MQGAASLHNQYMHLTNYSINKHSSKFVQNNDATADDTGSKVRGARVRARPLTLTQTLTQAPTQTLTLSRT